MNVDDIKRRLDEQLSEFARNHSRMSKEEMEEKLREMERIHSDLKELLKEELVTSAKLPHAHTKADYERRKTLNAS